ncbi:MAG: PKD domain-containing protein, partial [Patescibacteria group bacterium]
PASTCYNNSGARVLCTSYLWNFGDEKTSTDKNPSNIYSAKNNYTVTLTAYDETGLGCITSLPVTIKDINANDLPLWKEISPFK